jgi:hypothetical protein
MNLLRWGGLDKIPERDVFFDAAKKLIEQWQGNRFAGLYLYGEPATGKSLAAIGLARELHDNGAEVHYRHVPRLSDKNRLNEVAAWTGTRWDADLKGPLMFGCSIFPATYNASVQRNPKSVLILDDYKPDKQVHIATAVEAGAQFGGLVVITSNYPDPFKLMETPKVAPANIDELAAETMIGRDNPEGLTGLRSAQAAKLAEISAGLRSRISAGFKFIEFTGPDRRQQNSFWGD